MDAQSKREILADSLLCENLLPNELAMIADLFTIQSYQENDIIFHEGAAGDSIFVIASGRVEILSKSKNGEFVPMAMLSTHQFFGEMSLIDKRHRSATIRAKEESKLLQLSNENLHIFAKNFRNGFTWVVVNIARVLSARLREANIKLAEKMV